MVSLIIYLTSDFYFIFVLTRISTGAGKTTLLTNVGSGNIEGMPPDLKTLYVMHDDQSEDFGVSIVDEAMTCKELEGTGVTRDELIAALRGIHFTDEMMTYPRSSLSGGWLMKLILVKAMLSKADILLVIYHYNSIGFFT
jgi:hypothetical protein